MLKIKVKAGSITNLTDARYFAAREVEWLGFPIGKGEGLIEPLQVKAIAEWVDGVKIVGEFGFSQRDEILTVCQQIGIDTVQVGMFFSNKEISELKGLRIIKEVVVDSSLTETQLEDHLDAYANLCDFFLLNFSATGYTWADMAIGHPFTIDFIKGICKKHRIILNLDCHESEVDKMISEIEPFAIGINGGEEERVGVKSFDDLDEILDVLEIE